MPQGCCPVRICLSLSLIGCLDAPHSICHTVGTRLLLYIIHGGWVTVYSSVCTCSMEKPEEKWPHKCETYVSPELYAWQRFFYWSSWQLSVKCFTLKTFTHPPHAPTFPPWVLHILGPESSKWKENSTHAFSFVIGMRFLSLLLLSQRKKSITPPSPPPPKKNPNSTEKTNLAHTMNSTFAPRSISFVVLDWDVYCTEIWSLVVDQ